LRKIGDMPSPEDNIAIRRARAADAGGILRCLAAAFEPYRSSYTPGAYLDTVLTPEAIQQRFASMQVLVAAAAGDQIVGTIACAMESAEEGHLRGMAVLPQWLGRGIAGKLLRAAEAHLARQGCSRITLDTTEPLERAMRFYEKHGYRRSGKTTDFYGMPLHEYWKKLEPTSLC
jgi:ribosomal protein S18 acetylase RimI-like enzyme